MRIIKGKNHRPNVGWRKCEFIKCERVVLQYIHTCTYTCHIILGGVSYLKKREKTERG